MKDALGHGSNGNNGVHAAPINALPAKGDGRNVMSDQMWRQTMPQENFTGQVQDMLGMWNGSHKPAALSADETKQCSDAYAQRADWRKVAADIHTQRSGQ